MIADLGHPAVFRVIAGLGALFFFILVIACRRFKRAAELDKAEEILRAEFERDEKG
jgi:hypothetical protein